MTSQPEATSSGPTKCPVYFCGNTKASVVFDTFFSNVEKISSVSAERLTALNEVTAKANQLPYGVVIFLLANKSDLVALLNTLVALKKKISSGPIRVLAFNLLDNEKIASVIKSKGGAETFTEGLTQKALVHKLQKHVQIVATKYKQIKQSESSENSAGKGASANSAADRAKADTSKLKFVAALVDPNDCWLVKNKRDFKYVRGNWIGELIGPGPSIGTWVEAGGTTTLPIYRWSPRKKGEDPFVPGPGAWFFAGRKPEFEWKTNRWRFVGELPSLFYRPADAPPDATSVFRFRSTSAGSLDVALNSVPAKGKLKAIIDTFNDEKVIKDDKPKQKESKDVTLEKEKKKARGGDYDGDISPDEDAKEWGELQEGEEETREWGELKEGEKEEAREWGDQSDTEDEDKKDWTGMDVGRGNKFNSGRGVGQGDGNEKGYKYDDEEGGIKDRTGEGEEEDEHDWTGLDVGRGNKFTSGRGLGQGTGDKGYKYDKDKKGARKKSGGDGDDEDLLGGDEDLDLGEDLEDLADDGDGNLTMNGELDEILGEPSEDSEWDTGAAAFEKITLDITVSRVDAPGSPALGDVSLLERKGSELLLDAPSSSFTLGERVSFAVILGNAGEKKKLQLTGSLMTMEPAGDNRDIILVSVTEVSQPHLKEIETVFEQRQEQLLKFLREAKG